MFKAKDEFTLTNVNIRKVRKAKNMTQRQFADWLHVSKSTILAWEKGTRKCPMSMLEYSLLKFRCNM